MRKWMRERITRRKKDPKESAAEAQSAPLQPAYFDQAIPPAPVSAPDSESKDVSESKSSPAARSQRARSQAEVAPSDPPESAEKTMDTHAAELASAENAGPQPNVQQPRRPDSELRQGRRRRGRGGRGRGGPRPVRSESKADAGVQHASHVEAPAPSADQAENRELALGQQNNAMRPSKGVVVLAIGLPGSGKSSWFKRNSISPLSSDLLRSLLFDDPTEQRFQDLVFSNLRSMLKARLIARRPLNYVDATNLTSHDRRGWIKLAKDYGYEVQAVFFDVPLDVCLDRNRRRERVVSEDVMRRMAAKQKPPTFEEGFAKITVVRVKSKP
jgi:predicted kinase